MTDTPGHVDRRDRLSIRECVASRVARIDWSLAVYARRPDAYSPGPGACFNTQEVEE